MDLASTLRRAARGMREEARLHVVSVSSLAIAFLGLGIALLVLANLDSLATAWERAGRVTIFLRDGARQSDVDELATALSSIPGVASVTHVSSAEAREQFVADAQLGASLETLPPDAFTRRSRSSSRAARARSARRRSPIASRASRSSRMSRPTEAGSSSCKASSRPAAASRWASPSSCSSACWSSSATRSGSRSRAVATRSK